MKAITKKEAIERATQYGLDWEVKQEMELHNCSPMQALYEWDLLTAEELESF